MVGVMGGIQKKQPGSLWVRDVSVEQEIAKFLDDNFYSKAVTDFHRFKSKDDQLKGKDIRFTWDDLVNIIVDEKAQSQYINRDLPTFAFEISSIFSGKRSEGWLFNDAKETEYYLCIWIWAERTWNISADDIIKLDCLLLKRSDIIVYLEMEGFTKKRIVERENEIRASGEQGPFDKTAHQYIYFFNTTKRVERPFNVIIRKQKLIELAVRHIEVNRGKYTIL